MASSSAHFQHPAIKSTQASRDRFLSIISNDAGFETLKSSPVICQYKKADPVVICRAVVDINCNSKRVLDLIWDLPRRSKWDQEMMEGRELLVLPETAHDTRFTSIIHQTFKGHTGVSSRDVLLLRSAVTLPDGKIVTSSVSLDILPGYLSLDGFASPVMDSKNDGYCEFPESTVTAKEEIIRLLHIDSESKKAKKEMGYDSVRAHVHVSGTVIEPVDDMSSSRETCKVTTLSQIDIRGLVPSSFLKFGCIRQGTGMEALKAYAECSI